MSSEGAKVQRVNCPQWHSQQVTELGSEHESDYNVCSHCPHETRFWKGRQGGHTGLCGGTGGWLFSLILFLPPLRSLLYPAAKAPCSEQTQCLSQQSCPCSGMRARNCHGSKEETFVTALNILRLMRSSSLHEPEYYSCSLSRDP